MLHGDVTPALIIDEAQSMPHELLEEIRLIANIETPQDKLLPIMLAGQPELADRLNHPSLRQFKQRVGLRCELRPLDLGETGAYITARVSVAGGQAAAVFTREAVMVIHERSNGIPRLISVICHNALIMGSRWVAPMTPAASGRCAEISIWARPCGRADRCTASDGWRRQPSGPSRRRRPCRREACSESCLENSETQTLIFVFLSRGQNESD